MNTLKERRRKMYMTKLTYHYAHGPLLSHTVRLPRHLFKKIYGGKLAMGHRLVRKGISGYHCPPL